MRFIIPVLASATLAAQGQLSLADTERAFAQLAQEKGVSPAFSAFFAPEGIVFAPGPTSAHARHDGKPDNGVRLAWQPSFAELAASDDLGWTTGPSSWRVKPTDPARHGHFVSIWRKQPDGRWKVALDLGIGHAEPPPTPFVQAPIRKGRALSPDERERVRCDWLEVEANFNALSAAKGRAAALEVFGADDLRTYREGLLPTRSRKEGQALVAFDEASTHSSLEGSGMSAAGDLAFSYGLASSRHFSGADPLPFAFVRIWRKGPGSWRLAVDIQIPAADKQKT